MTRQTWALFGLGEPSDKRTDWGINMSFIVLRGMENGTCRNVSVNRCEINDFIVSQ